MNSEYSPLEALNGRENDPAEHYFRFDPQGYAYDPTRARYLEQFAVLRTGTGNKYLAYGTMLSRLEIPPTDTDDVLVPLQHRPAIVVVQGRGSIVVHAVLHTAWKAGAGPA